MSVVEQDVARLQDQVQALERGQKRLQVAVDSLSALVRSQTREVRERRAGGEERVSQLELDLQALRSELDAMRAEIAELKDQQRYQAPVVDAGVASATESGDTPRALYDAAYQDLSRGNHELALMGFQEVLSRYPSSELADNAQYWIGEVYYDQKDYAAALEQFRKVEENYPTGDKVPASLLKIGKSLRELGQTAEARRALQSLVERFPSTEEARLARDMLASD
jgi:tol-pal system protein YbgF